MNSIIVFSSLSFLFFSPQLEVELSPGTICIFFYFFFFPVTNTEDCNERLTRRGHNGGSMKAGSPAVWEIKKISILIIYFLFFSPFSPQKCFDHTHARVKQRPCVHLLWFDSLLSDELRLLCILCLSDSLYLPGAFAPQWIKNGANRSRRILNGRQPWLWAAGMCHKLTPGQYVLLTLIINVIFGRGRKKAVKLMKDTDEHLYGWPTMHRYAQMQLFFFSLFFSWARRERGRGRTCRYITPLSGHEGLFSLARVLILFVVLERNKTGGNGAASGQTKALFKYLKAV